MNCFIYVLSNLLFFKQILYLNMAILEKIVASRKSVTKMSAGFCLPRYASTLIRSIAPILSSLRSHGNFNS